MKATKYATKITNTDSKNIYSFTATERSPASPLFEKKKWINEFLEYIMNL